MDDLLNYDQLEVVWDEIKIGFSGGNFNLAAPKIIDKLKAHLRALEDIHARELTTIGELSEYIDKLERIIHDSANLSDIMRNGHSEEIYKSINQRLSYKNL